ncbi:MAG: hypothetical protein RL701_7201, partial [Pseudomonadota bacterium]
LVPAALGAPAAEPAVGVGFVGTTGEVTTVVPAAPALAPATVDGGGAIVPPTGAVGWPWPWP